MSLSRIFNECEIGSLCRWPTKLNWKTKQFKCIILSLFRSSRKETGSLYFFFHVIVASLLVLVAVGRLDGHGSNPVHHEAVSVLDHPVLSEAEGVGRVGPEPLSQGGCPRKDQPFHQAAVDLEIKIREWLIWYSSAQLFANHLRAKPCTMYKLLYWKISILPYCLFTDRPLLEFSS